MLIPGTKRIEVAAEIPQGNELFSFCIEELSSAAYLQEYFQKINEHLPSYVFSLKKLALHQGRYDSGISNQSPLELALKFLQKTTIDRVSDSGDLGEFLLFLFAKNVKGAHKVATKIQSRGSIRSPLQGRDNSYAWRDEAGEVYMLLGEAKMRPDANDCLRDAQGQLNQFWQNGNVNHEINLASTHIVDEMTEADLPLYEAFFIDGTEQHNNLKYKNIIFIGYSCEPLTNLINTSISPEEFLEAMQSDLNRCFVNQKGLIDDSLHPSLYCFVPFESIDIARTTFAQLNNLIIQ